MTVPPPPAGGLVLPGAAQPAAAPVGIYAPFPTLPAFPGRSQPPLAPAVRSLLEVATSRRDVDLVILACGAVILLTSLRFSAGSGILAIVGSLGVAAWFLMGSISYRKLHRASVALRGIHWRTAEVHAGLLGDRSQALVWALRAAVGSLLIPAALLLLFLALLGGVAGFGLTAVVAGLGAFVGLQIIARYLRLSTMAGIAVEIAPDLRGLTAGVVIWEPLAVIFVTSFLLGSVTFGDAASTLLAAGFCGAAVMGLIGDFQLIRCYRDHTLPAAIRLSGSSPFADLPPAYGFPSSRPPVPAGGVGPSAVDSVRPPLGPSLDGGRPP